MPVADKAIVVGVGRYPTFGADCRSANDLQGPVADAVAVADWLVGTAKAEVTQILSTGGPGEPWQVTDRRPNVSDVEAAFDPFLATQQNVATRLYVYMAGHGLAPDPRSRCLILADALGAKRVPNIEAPAWIDWFANQYQFDELVLWMDCCATQALDYARGRPALPQTIARADGTPPAKVFMAFGSAVGRNSYEGPIGPGGEIRGLFTERLLRGLRGQAANQAGEVRTASLVSFLYNGSSATSAEVRSNTTPQPMILQADDMLFARVALHAYVIAARADDGSTYRTACRWGCWTAP